MNTAATPVASRPSPWIVGPRFDLTFFLGSALPGFLILAVHTALPYTGVLLLCALVSMCVDQTHVLHTITRTYLDRKEFGRAPRFYLVTVAAVFAVLLGACIAGVGYALSLVLYASAWHQTKQHYGFLRLYDRRRPHSGLGRLDSWIDNFCLFGGILAGVLYIFRIPGLGEVEKPLVYPHIPAAISLQGMGLVGAGFVAMASREVYRWMRFREVAWQKCLLVALAVGLVWTAALTATQLIVILVAVTSFHAVQYIAITWLYNRNKYASGVAPENPLTSRLVQPRWVWMYFALGIIYGAVVLGMQRVDVLVPIAYTLTGTHFVVDWRIWKVRYCPDLRENLRPVRAIPIPQAGRV